MSLSVIAFIADNIELIEREIRCSLLLEINCRFTVSNSINVWTVLTGYCTFSFQAYQGTCVTKKLKIFLTMLPEVIIIECVGVLGKI